MIAFEAAAVEKSGNPLFTFVILAALIGVLFMIIRSSRSLSRRRAQQQAPPQAQPPRAPGAATITRPQAPARPPAAPVVQGSSPGVGPGSVIGGYKVESRVGRGGMAVVYRARDERLGRHVALKVLAPAFADDAEFRQRFVRESRAAAALDDPHIIPVYEARQSGDVLFIAMRYVSGGDVRTLLDREGPLSPSRTAAVISPVASALDSAHAAGLIHRDIKPANILIDTRPRRPDHVYLSDFGLSKTSTASASLTSTGQFMGTLDYVAPEQIEGKDVDGRTDQYALACTAYELLAGEPPFRRNDPTAIMYAQLTQPPPALTSLRADLTAAVDHVFATALAKSPFNRFPTCTDFAESLRAAIGLPAYQADTPAAPHPHPPTQIA